ncbi:hypothetical protein BDZ97DRAFT_1915598 [Flammula alnicola]|nr:hypothetical protein BDZ97DRAFT_1915598 [Flammula alnicola]
MESQPLFDPPLVPIETELYELLGVSFNASEDEIKKAYKRKAKEHHPDKNINDPEAGQKFQEMAAAYEILSDANKRSAYDTHGLDGMGSSRGDPMDPANFFAQFFAGGGGGGNPMFGFDFGPDMPGGRRRGKGEDSVIPYDVTLEDLYNGKSVKMNMEKEVICSVCKGSGARGNAKPKPCSTCEGQGWTNTKIRLPTGAYGISKAACKECHGLGERLKEKERCKKCKGEKTVKEKTRQEIFVEKGMTDRQRIVLAGGGDQEPGIPAGDVIFILKASQHESFERSGNDLLTNVTITLSEALLGFSRIIITHLDGRGIKMTTPPGKIIKPQDSIAVEAVLPPKRTDVDPQPEAVDEADFEESDIVDVGARSFPAGRFFDQAFASQFGEDDEDWEEDEDDEDGEPDCRPQ